jgi:tripartite-type tricarboxylate transporter receptor subunit TctC
MGEALGSAGVRKLYLDVSEEPAQSTPEAFGRLIREDFDAMGRLVKLANVTAE